MSKRAFSLYRASVVCRFRKDVPTANRLWYEALYFGTPRWLSEAQWAEMNAQYDEAKGTSKAIDHVIPLRGVSEDGYYNICGLNVPWNLELLPKHENSSKGNRFYLADREKEERRLLKQTSVPADIPIVITRAGIELGDTLVLWDVAIGRGIDTNLVEITPPVDAEVRNSLMSRFYAEMIKGWTDRPKTPANSSIFGLPRLYKITIPAPQRKKGTVASNGDCHACGEYRRLYGKRDEHKFCAKCQKLTAEQQNTLYEHRYFSWLCAEYDYQLDAHRQFTLQQKTKAIISILERREKEKGDTQMSPKETTKGTFIIS